MSEPHDIVRQWAPHVLMLVLIAVGLWLIAMVFKPLFISLLLSASIAGLTYSLIFEPISRLLLRLGSGRLSTGTLRQIAAVAATVMVAVVVVSPLIFLLAGMLGSFQAIQDVIYGFVTRDMQLLEALFASIERSLYQFNNLYPRLAIPESSIQAIRAASVEMVLELRDFGPHFLRFLFAGSGHLAQYILAFISLSFFYAQGPRLVNAILHYTPLQPAQVADLKRHHRTIINHLLTDSLGLAFARGLILGSVAWLCHPDFNFFIVASLAAFFSLLPVVGFSLVWIPLAYLSYQQQAYVSMIAVSAVGLLAGYGLTWLWNSVGHRVNARSSWLSFGLFLGFIGGILTFGTKGLVIGPMAVVFTSTFTRFWLPLYGIANPLGSELEDDE